MTSENKQVLSEWAPFVEEYRKSIERLNGSIQLIERDAARCTNEDDRGGMLLQSYEWQYMVLALENKIEKCAEAQQKTNLLQHSFD